MSKQKSPTLPPNKMLYYNIGLFAALLVILFRLYFPVIADITDKNAQLDTAAEQIKTLESLGNGEMNGRNQQTIFAMPEAEQSHLSQEMESLVQKTSVRLIQVQADSDNQEPIKNLKLKSMPYLLSFASNDPQKIAMVWFLIETRFPELYIGKVDYKSEVGRFEAKLLTSP